MSRGATSGEAITPDKGGIGTKESLGKRLLFPLPLYLLLAMRTPLFFSPCVSYKFNAHSFALLFYDELDKNLTINLRLSINKRRFLNVSFVQKNNGALTILCSVRISRLIKKFHLMYISLRSITKE